MFLYIFQLSHENNQAWYKNIYYIQGGVNQIISFEKWATIYVSQETTFDKPSKISPFYGDLCINRIDLEYQDHESKTF